MAILMKVLFISLVLSVVTAELDKCVYPCASHQCGPGERCVPYQLQCIRAPCCKVPRCTKTTDQDHS